PLRAAATPRPVATAVLPPTARPVPPTSVPPTPVPATATAPAPTSVPAVAVATSAPVVGSTLAPLPTLTLQDPPELRAVWVDAFHDGFKTPQQVDELVAWARS